VAAPQQALAFTPLPALPASALASLTPQQQLRVQQQAQHLARRMFRDPFQTVRRPDPTATRPGNGRNRRNLVPDQHQCIWTAMTCGNAAAFIVDMSAVRRCHETPPHTPKCGRLSW
jgi:hypothetical protein